MVLSRLQYSLYGINRNRYYYGQRAHQVGKQEIHTPPETSSEDIGIRGRELVTALCLSKISSRQHRTQQTTDSTTPKTQECEI